MEKHNNYGIIASVPNMAVFETAEAARDPLLIEALRNGYDPGEVVGESLRNADDLWEHSKSWLGWLVLFILRVKGHKIDSVLGIHPSQPWSINEAARCFMEDHPALVRVQEQVKESIGKSKTLLKAVDLLQRYYPEVHARALNGTNLCLEGSKKAICNSLGAVAACISEAVSPRFSVDPYVLFGPLTDEMGWSVRDPRGMCRPHPAKQWVSAWDNPGRFLYGDGVIQVN